MYHTIFNSVDEESNQWKQSNCSRMSACPRMWSQTHNTSMPYSWPTLLMCDCARVVEVKSKPYVSWLKFFTIWSLQNWMERFTSYWSLFSLQMCSILPTNTKWVSPLIGMWCYDIWILVEPLTCICVYACACTCTYVHVHLCVCTCMSDVTIYVYGVW